MGVLLRSGFYDKIPQTGSLRNNRRAPLVVQGLRLCIPNAAAQGSIPGHGTWYHTVQLILHSTTKIKVSVCSN